MNRTGSTPAPSGNALGNKLHLPRVGSEILLIVLSVLAAFWMESWREGRKEREHERGLIKAMRSEFVTSGKLLDSLEVWHTRSGGRLTQLGALLDAPDAVANADSVARLGQALWGFFNYLPKMPAYRELVSTSGIEGVHNVDLRRALFEYEATLALNGDWDEYVRSSSISYWEPLVAKWMPELITAKPSEDPLRRLLPDVRRLANDLEFRNLITTRKVAEVALAKQSGEIRIAVDKVIKLIDREGH